MPRGCELLMAADRKVAAQRGGWCYRPKSAAHSAAVVKQRWLPPAVSPGAPHPDCLQGPLSSSVQPVVNLVDHHSWLESRMRLSTGYPVRRS